MRSWRRLSEVAGLETGGAGGDGSGGGIIGARYLMREIVRLQSGPQPFAAALRPSLYPSPRDHHAETLRRARRAVLPFLLICAKHSPRAVTGGAGGTPAGPIPARRPPGRSHLADRAGRDGAAAESAAAHRRFGGSAGDATDRSPIRV